MGADQYRIVEQGSLHDEDGPHELDVSIVPEYAEINKENVFQLRQLAERLNENYDVTYIVISNSHFQDIRQRRQ